MQSSESGVLQDTGPNPAGFLPTHAEKVQMLLSHLGLEYAVGWKLPLLWWEEVVARGFSSTEISSWEGKHLKVGRRFGLGDENDL